MNKNVTMKDIAKQMEVSVVSVSKALSGKDGVSDEVRRRIIEKAQELGYVYSTPQKSVPHRHSNIGIIVADRFFKDNSFYSGMYRPILVKCAEAGFSGILEIVMPQDEKGCILPNIITSNKVDGIIFLGEINPNYIKAVASTGLNCVMLDFYDDSNGDSIVSDGIYGTYVLTRHLIETGHRDIRFVGTITATSSILDRYLGFCKALLKNNLPFNPSEVIPDRGADGKFVELTLPEKMPDAFVCNCDEVAYLLIEKLKASGYNVPDDVSVVGFDDYRFATLCSPPLTTFRVDLDAMGSAAINLLVRKIYSKNYTKGRTIISGFPVFRESTKNRLTE